MRVRILYENHSGFRKGPLGGHGFSTLVEKEGIRVLVDTGTEGDVLLHNMDFLDVRPDSIDYVFLTHGHYDHTGGLKSFLEARSRSVKIIAHPGIFARRVALKPTRREIGIPFGRDELEELGAEFILTEKPLKFAPGFISSGEIERTTWDRAVGYLVEGEALRPDPVRDDMTLLIDTEKGTVVITGCGHSGVINIARHAERVTNKPVRAVLGGLHLAGAGEELLEDVVRNVKAKLYAGHCTGLESFAYLRCKADAEPLYVGRVIEF